MVPSHLNLNGIGSFESVVVVEVVRLGFVHDWPSQFINMYARIMSMRTSKTSLSLPACSMLIPAVITKLTLTTKEESANNLGDGQSKLSVVVVSNNAPSAFYGAKHSAERAERAEDEAHFRSRGVGCSLFPQHTSTTWFSSIYCDYFTNYTALQHTRKTEATPGRRGHQKP